MSTSQIEGLKCPNCGHEALCLLLDGRTYEESNFCFACGNYDEWKLEWEVGETGEYQPKLDEQGKFTWAHTERGPFGSITLGQQSDPTGITMTVGFDREQTVEELLALANERKSEGCKVHFLSQWKDGRLKVLIGSLDDMPKIWGRPLPGA